MEHAIVSKRAGDEESVLSNGSHSSTPPTSPPPTVTRQRKKRRVNGAAETPENNNVRPFGAAAVDGVRSTPSHQAILDELLLRRDQVRLQAEQIAALKQGLSTQMGLISALASPLNLHPRDSLKAASPVHWEVVSSRVIEVTKFSTVESACVSLINDQTHDVRILCQKLNHLSALVHRSSQLNRALFDLAMRMVVGKIVDTGHRYNSRGIDIKAVIYAVRQAVNVAAPFGYQELWDWKLEVEFQDYEGFTDEVETKRWARFALAMDTDKATLWKHFSQQGMLSTALDFGFLPCKGLGWVVANFTRRRLYFLEADSVTISKTENYGIFSLTFVIPGAGPANTPSRVLFPQVSARQMLKRSKLNLEEWYNISNSGQGLGFPLGG